VVHGEGGKDSGLLDSSLGGGRHREKARSGGLDPLPLGGTTIQTTVTYWRKFLVTKSTDPVPHRRRTPGGCRAARSGLPLPLAFSGPALGAPQSLSAVIAPALGAATS
jgi:hypothetical protein